MPNYRILTRSKNAKNQKNTEICIVFPHSFFQHLSLFTRFFAQWLDTACLQVLSLPQLQELSTF